MYSQSFTLKKSEPAQKKSSRARLFAGSLVVVGTVAAMIASQIPAQGN